MKSPEVSERHRAAGAASAQDVHVRAHQRGGVLPPRAGRGSRPAGAPIARAAAVHRTPRHLICNKHEPMITVKTKYLPTISITILNVVDIKEKH